MHPALHTSQWASGPSTHSKTSASSLNEQDSLFHSYEHLIGVPDPDEGLSRLRKIASLVKPIMRKRAWQVRILSEFMPGTPNLLGLNINKGYKICVRLRYSHSPGTFLPFEQTVDTMLHELSHIIWGAHDANFHALWDELRNEYETLIMRGYTEDGFLSKRRKLGGGRVPPTHEIRRMARANAEKRRVLQKGSGKRVGGSALRRGTDARQVIADAAERRNRIDNGCASGTADAGRLAEQASEQGFKTKAEEDDANDRAIAEALFELMEEEEGKKIDRTFTSPPPSGGLAWSPDKGLHLPDETKRDVPASEEEQLKWALRESMEDVGARSRTIDDSKVKQNPGPGTRSLYDATPDLRAVKRTKSQISSNNVFRFHDPEVLSSNTPMTRVDQPGSRSVPVDLTEDKSPSTISHEPDTWTCGTCTCINPRQFLACDACGVERPHAAPVETAAVVARKPVPPTTDSIEAPGLVL